MAVYSITPGHPDHSGNWLPTIFAVKLIVAFYAATVFAAICNTDYEGEIKSQGEKVVIRQRPTITIRDHVKGQNLNYQNPSSEPVELLIDKGKYWGASLDDVDKAQSDINWITEWSEDAGERMKIAIDTDVLANIYADAHASNAGATAGAISGDINLGATGAPLAVTKDNILDVIVDCGTVLTEQNVPESQRKLVLPAWACGMIKKSDLKDASIAGDGTSIMRNGRIGMIDRFEIFESNNLATTTDGSYTVYNSLFCHPVATTFASQVVQSETLRNPNAFGDLIRGLQVYGYKVTKPEALGHLYIRKG